MILLGLAACKPGELTVVEPDDSDGGPSLGTLVAQVELRSTDSALADSLGWSEGVPGARVRILRNGTAEWLEAETDDTGTAVLENLEPGQYFTYVERTLSQGEAGQVSGVVRGFGDGALVPVNADTIRRTYRFRTSRRTGLVISEVSGAAPVPWEVPGAKTSGNYFFEIYNQSNSTRYLDGLIFGTFSIGRFCDGVCANSCARGAPVRTDSTGVYFVSVIQFPGSGSEYPIASGETKLIAGAALDHRELHEDMLDHRDADFEIGGTFTSYADNPEVPNMNAVGTRPFYLSHLVQSTRLWFLAESVDPLSFPITWRSVRGNGFRKIPAEFVLDVASHKLVWPDNDAEKRHCIPMIHPAIDGLPGGFKESGTNSPFLSLQREILTTQDGIPIFMDTNTSASDFSIKRYTPGELPEGQ